MTEKEYNVCVDKYSDGVFAYLVRNMRDEQVAKDVLQDSFLSLWKNRAKVEKEKSKSFLFTVAHNFMINTFNYNKIRQRNIETEEITEDKDFENKDMVRHLTAILSPMMKECLILRDIEGFAYKEIAQMLKITEENVKINIFRARIKIKQYATKEGQRNE
ncbi:MAG: RNA polymerase sigma factor [Bacteroidota bacterium]|nr:RNA polymerase sigma factor [Bacteroidota bacterium]